MSENSPASHPEKTSHQKAWQRKTMIQAKLLCWFDKSLTKIGFHVSQLLACIRRSPVDTRKGCKPQVCFAQWLRSSISAFLITSSMKSPLDMVKVRGRTHKVMSVGDRSHEPDCLSLSSTIPKEWTPKSGGAHGDPNLPVNSGKIYGKACVTWRH